MSTYTYLFIILAAWNFELLPTLLCVVIALAFLGMLIQNRMVVKRVQKRLEETHFTGKMMEQAVKISASNVVRFVIREGYIYQLYGHIFPDKGLTSEEWKSHLHPDDVEEVVRRFRRIIAGKVKRDDFFYRWNFDFTGSQPQWGYMHNVSVVEVQPGTSIPQSIISTLHDETELREQEIREGNLTERYKQIFEHSIVGLSFYSADGWLLDANKEMREICHFDSDTWDEHFSTMNLFDAMPFNEILNRSNVEEFWCCSQSIVPERGIHDYLEIHLHPIRDDEGELVYIALAVRNVTEERQMYLQAKLNDIQIQKVNEEIMHYEEELRYMMEACDMRAWRASFKERKMSFFKGLGTLEKEVSFEEISRHFVNPPEDLIRIFEDPYKYYTHSTSHVVEVVPVFHPSDKMVWDQINSIPVYDDNGQLTGAFGLIRNITGIMEKQELLKRETERANDSGRLKSVFLANMTHEIRTPLNAIVGFTDLLQAIDSPDDKREMIRVIHNNCDMLLRLINDILVLSNMDANVMEIVPHDIDVSKNFEELAKTLSQRVQEPGVEFLKDNPYEMLQARLDSDRLNQVLTNFVTNAVKYTHQGYIKVGYRQQMRNEQGEISNDGTGRQGLYFYCEDTGSGIPKDKHAAVFERFVKLNDYVQGTGLGLPICKAIVEKSGGVIGLESEVGEGTKFWFWIPVDVHEVKEKSGAS